VILNDIVNNMYQEQMHPINNQINISFGLIAMTSRNVTLCDAPSQEMNCVHVHLNKGDGSVITLPDGMMN
jgi:hypothetical protein